MNDKDDDETQKQMNEAGACQGWMVVCWEASGGVQERSYEAANSLRINEMGSTTEETTHDLTKLPTVFVNSQTST